MLMRHIDRISLSSKLVACTIAVLLIGVSVNFPSPSARW